jgi:hypothetical protein
MVVNVFVRLDQTKIPATALTVLQDIFRSEGVEVL